MNADLGPSQVSSVEMAPVGGQCCDDFDSRFFDYWKVFGDLKSLMSYFIFALQVS